MSKRSTNRSNKNMLLPGKNNKSYKDEDIVEPVSEESILLMMAENLEPVSEESILSMMAENL
ncbi:hypothetical protein EAG_03753 [Camponotus floridanus]|uniref:Uncharacterized protein n=1 Tax=Camponotus floridanus TaxID=104421 RepID=E2B158_CAMFO|nr:hypothetical protein EAG_03753 [Camponotus floridanus]